MSTVTQPDRHDLRWAAAAIVFAIVLAFIAPALPGGPSRPRPHEHPAAAAAPAPAMIEQRNDAVTPPDSEQPPPDQQLRLWPSVFFFGADAMNQPGSGE